MRLSARLRRAKRPTTTPTATVTVASTGRTWRRVDDAYLDDVERAVAERCDHQKPYSAVMDAFGVSRARAYQLLNLADERKSR